MSAAGYPGRGTVLRQRQDHAHAGPARGPAPPRRGRRARSRSGPTISTPPSTAVATERPTFNIDPWAMRFETLAGLLEASGQGCDLLVGEGVMGLFDGAADGTGATADIAALFGLPVVLLIDVTGMGASVAAADRRLSPPPRGRRGHRRRAQPGRQPGPWRDPGPRLLRERLHAGPGHDPTRPRRSQLPSRHLGLVQASEHPDLATFLAAAADLVEERIDLDRLQRLARHPSVSILGPDTRPWPPLGQRIAVARDRGLRVRL